MQARIAVAKPVDEARGKTTGNRGVTIGAAADHKNRLHWDSPS
jgi:hypothetical protein